MHQDQAAMKVGTDGVLIGAWTPLQLPGALPPYRMLDIGSGSGLIALMLAQRSSAEQIDAVEINAAAYEQATFNFEASPWNDRLFCYHASFQEFAEEFADDPPYDLICCNPPFYRGGTSTLDPARNQARIPNELPFEQLIVGVTLLLASDGLFSTILPASETPDFIKLAQRHGLHLNRMTRVKGRPETSVKRCLLQFSFRELPAGRQESKIVREELIIETERHQYTPEYQNLTKEFYLKM
ncbi:tRNA1(Val) (adenine(37)-N6)-methyltransferase [Croceiramulus getboli]